MIDTSVWISAFRGKTPVIVTVTQRLLRDDRILTCGPVLLEIKRGLKLPERKKVMPLFKAVTRLAFEEKMWDEAGDLDATLRRKGITIPPLDVLIAQTCLHHKVSLFTLDEHFKSVPGLKLFEP